MTMFFTKIAVAVGMLVASLSFTSCVHADNFSRNISKSEAGVRDFPCYSEKLVSTKMNLPAFTSISSTNCSDIEFIQTSGETFVRAEGHVDDPLRYLNIWVTEGKLIISFRESNEGIIQKYGGRRTVDSYIKLYIGAPTLASINMSGTADFKCETLKQSSEFRAVMVGTGDVDFKTLYLSRLHVSLNGTGDFKAALVNADDSQLYLNGTGDISIPRLSSNSMYALVAGTGDIELHSLTVTNLTGTISGTGDIKLNGICKETARLTVSGTGDLEARLLNANNVEAMVTGPGSLSCKPLSSINGTCTFGDLTYYGSPKKVNVSGKVQHK